MSIIIDSCFNIGINKIPTKRTIDISGRSGLVLPSGTINERPTASNEYLGCLRYNSDNAYFEGYTDEGWVALNIFQDTTGESEITFDSSGIKYFVNDKEQMIITDSSGYIGINKNPTYELDVSGILNCNSLYINYSDVSVSDVGGPYLEDIFNIGILTELNGTDLSSGLLRVTNDMEIYNLNVNGDFNVNQTIDICGDLSVTGTMTCDSIYFEDQTQLKINDIDCKSVGLPHNSSTTGSSGDFRYNPSTSLIEGYYSGIWTTVTNVITNVNTILPYMVFNHTTDKLEFTDTSLCTELTRLPLSYTSETWFGPSYEIITNDSSVFGYAEDGGQGFTILDTGVYLATITYTSDCSYSQEFRYVFFRDDFSLNTTLIPEDRDASNVETNGEFKARVDASGNFGMENRIYNLYNDESTSDISINYSEGPVNVGTISAGTYIQSCAQTFQFTISTPCSLILFLGIHNVDYATDKNLQLRITRIANINTITTVEYNGT